MRSEHLILILRILLNRILRDWILCNYCSVLLINVLQNSHLHIIYARIFNFLLRLGMEVNLVCICAIFRNSDHLWAEQVHTIAKRNFLIRIRINYLKESFNAQNRKVAILLWPFQLSRINIETERKHQIPKLDLINHAIFILIDPFEHRNEMTKELLMFSQLKIQNALHKHVEF